MIHYISKKPSEYSNNVKVIASISLEGDHRILIADFRKMAE
jgi:hypothetical protein